MLRKLIRWLIDNTAQHIYTALLGSAFVTALVSGALRSVLTLSWEWMWAIWTGTAVVSYVALVRTSPRWLPSVAPARRDLEPNDPPIDIVADAQKKRIRAQVGGFLRDLRNGIGSRALGEAMSLSQTAVTLLRIEPSNGERWLASNLIGGANVDLSRALDVMLKSQACETDAQLSEHLRGWKEVFDRYQSLVFATYSTFVALSVSPWEFELYRRWRGSDAHFIDALKRVEHMEGAEELAPALKGHWGDGDRPAPPEIMPTGQGKFPATAPVSANGVPRPTLEMLEAGRKERQAKREAQIQDWRRMVQMAQTELRRRNSGGHEPVTTAEVLESYDAFYPLKALISDRTKQALYGQTLIAAPTNSSLNGALHSLLADIDALEKEWGLL